MHDLDVFTLPEEERSPRWALTTSTLAAVVLVVGAGFLFAGQASGKLNFGSQPISAPGMAVAVVHVADGQVTARDCVDATRALRAADVPALADAAQQCGRDAHAAQHRVATYSHLDDTAVVVRMEWDEHESPVDPEDLAERYVRAAEELHRADPSLLVITTTVARTAPRAMAAPENVHVALAAPSPSTRGEDAADIAKFNRVVRERTDESTNLLDLAAIETAANGSQLAAACLPGSRRVLVDMRLTEIVDSQRHLADEPAAAHP